MSETLMPLEPAKYSVREKLEGDVRWEHGDTQETFNDKANAYARERLLAIEDGESAWLARNFDADHGRVYDFFHEGRFAGYVMNDYDAGVSVYGFDPSVQRFTLYVQSEPGSELTLEQAVGILEEYSRQ